MKLLVVKLWDDDKTAQRLRKILDDCLKVTGDEDAAIVSEKEFEMLITSGELRNSGILFTLAIDEGGPGFAYNNMLRFLRLNGQTLGGCVGGVIADGSSDLYTKDAARKLVLAANMAGCAFPGKCLVEARKNLGNFNVIAAANKISLEKAYLHGAIDLIKRITDFNADICDSPNILMVHASMRTTSNSLQLWELVKSVLENKSQIQEISLRNGQVWDCRGCKYEECLHFGEKSSCFYGGVMAEKVYPAILNCDVLVLICPNYNDAVSANITAFINRLTALFRTNDFTRKRIYAIVVSGYSGGDLVSEQILGAMSMNKSFMLPGNFVMMETANDPGSVLKISNIKERAEAFAKRIISG